jgi:two-component system sensor histidine kinase AtoS
MKLLKIRYRGFINQILILIAFLLLIPIALSIYLFYMVHSTEIGLINNQQLVLEKAMDHLDSSLDGSFEDLLAGMNTGAMTSREKEEAMNKALKPAVDRCLKLYPDLEVGYYSKDSDVLLDGNNEHLHENFSTRKKRYFDETIESRTPVLGIRGLFESGQLESYRPLIRDGQVIGAVWASENIQQIYKKIENMQRMVYGIIIVGVLLGFGGAFVLIRKFTRNVSDIKKGLKTITHDPTYIIPRGSGELGEISDAVNKMFKELIDVQNYNELILSSIDDGIIAVDKNERLIIFNPAAEKMFHLDRGCLGKKIDEVFAGSPFALYLRQTLTENKPVKDADIVYANAEDAPRHMLISTSLMINVRRERIGAQLHVRDVTEKVRLQERINRQERLASLGKLVAGVAHEIRSPLTSINGYIQFWNKGHTPSPKSLNIVNREMERISSITDKLLEFARPSRAVLAEGDLNSLVKRMVQFFVDSHGADIQINSSLAESLPTVMIDQRQIEQVLSNIMYNAYQAMDGKGRMEIATWSEGEKGVVCLSVRDSGCGIGKDIMRNMFEPFFTTKAKGTGLGLAIAHEIIEAHCGTIMAESALNIGTTVKICLPAVKRSDHINGKNTDR